MTPDQEVAYEAGLHDAMMALHADRTPQNVAAVLQVAMSQTWGRPFELPAMPSRAERDFYTLEQEVLRRVMATSENTKTTAAFPIGRITRMVQL